MRWLHRIGISIEIRAPALKIGWVGFFGESSWKNFIWSRVLGIRGRQNVLNERSKARHVGLEVRVPNWAIGAQWRTSSFLFLQKQDFGANVCGSVGGTILFLEPAWACLGGQLDRLLREPQIPPHVPPGSPSLTPPLFLFLCCKVPCIVFLFYYLIFILL